MNVKINADDYGWNESCTSAILQAFEQGFITTTTAVANTEVFEEAAARIQKTPYAACVGIHFDLTEGKPLTEAIARDPFFCTADGSFHGKIRRYECLTSAQKQAVYEELHAQAVRFAQTGLSFHHADSHHHIHTAPFITPIVLRVMREFGIKKLRIHRNIGNLSPVKRLMKEAFNLSLRLRGLAYSAYFGSFEDVAQGMERYGQKLEIMCHPDLTADGQLIDRDGASTYEQPVGKPLVQQRQKLR